MAKQMDVHAPCSKMSKMYVHDKSGNNLCHCLVGDICLLYDKQIRVWVAQKCLGSPATLGSMVYTFITVIVQPVQSEYETNPF